MHEQSETVQTPDGHWINVYGRGTPKAGQPLPGSRPFASSEEAVAAAKSRSENTRTFDVRLPDGTIVKNVPEGTTKADLMARVQKGRAAREPEESPTSAKNIAGAAIEPNLTLLSGMVAQPIAGIAGLVSAGGKALGMDTDPAGTVRQVSSALTYAPKTAGGKVATETIGTPFEKYGELVDEAGGKASDATGSPAIGAVVNALLNVGPSLAGVKGPSTVSNAAGGASRRLMQSALKPDRSDLKSGNAQKAIQTLLDEGVNVTPGGADLLGGRIGSLNDLIAEAIANSSATVNKNAVAGRLQDVTNRVERQVNPAADMRAVEGVWNEFSQHPLVPGADMPVQLAQEMKQGTYKRLREKYGELGSADTEAQKALARGLKEEIASVVPEVGPMNARESALLNAKEILDKRVLTAGNKNPLGIGGLSPRLANLVAMMTDRSELFKSLLARGLNPGTMSLSDLTAALATAPETFSDDMKERQAVIAALMQRQGAQR